MRKTLPCQLLFAALAASAAMPAYAQTAAPAAAQDAGRDATIDALFSSIAPRDPGAALGVYSKGKLVYAKGYGIADMEDGRAITPQTQFHVASVSKEFTAFAIALLAREGKVDLNADIRRYLPYVPDFGDVITVNHLIHHTSGLRDQWSLFTLGGQDMDNRLRQKQVVNMVSRQRGLNFKPGSEYTYSNTGYTLLAEIVHAVSGQTLRQFTEARIFKPLGMTKTFFFDDVDEIVPGRAQSYNRASPDKPWQRELLNYDNAGATSLFTTVEDLAKWAANFTNPIVGDRALIDQVTTNGTLSNGKPITYGFALQRTKIAGRDVITHSGADAGFRAIFVYYPGQDFAVAITTNTPFDAKGKNFAFDLPARVAAVADLYLPKVPAPVIPAVDPKANPAPLAGTYYNIYAHTLKLEARTDGLYADGGYGKPTKLTQRANGTFDAGPPINSYYTTIKAADGTIAALEQIVPNDSRVTRYDRITPIAPAAAALADFAGDYYSDELDITYTIAVEGDHLAVRSIWMPDPVSLTGVIKDRFESGSGMLGVIAFDRDAQGKVSGLKIHGGRVRHVALRKLNGPRS
jgi:CubicO group peptidase (beta-lactamase class C family)